MEKRRSRQYLEYTSRFYNEGRYKRFSYNEDNLMELALLQDLGNDIKEEEFDDRIKHRYSKTIGHISHTLYDVISKISMELEIFV